jgi:hypothetical protein
MNTKYLIKTSILIVFIPILLFPWMPARAADGLSLPGFYNFVSKVANGHGGVVTGVFVPGILADKVVQQAVNNPSYVASFSEVVTQFKMAVQFGAIGLLAHNTLAGEKFTSLKIGQEVRIIYGDGAVSYYTITSIDSFQALDPYSPTSNFVDLDTPAIYSSAQLFAKYYQVGNQVIFQTCIFRDGNASWGRLFITAAPGEPIQTNIIRIKTTNLLALVK